MMTEELKVKITVDTSDVDRSIDKVNKSFKSINGESKELSTATGATSESMRELYDQMEAIRDLNFAGLLIDNFDKVKEHTKGVTDSISAVGQRVKEAGAEIKGAFNFKNFDVGKDGFKGYMGSMKVQTMEAGKSIIQSLKNIGRAFVEMGKVVVAALNSTIGRIAMFVGAVVGMVAAVRNSLSVAQQIKTITNEANKLNMSAQAYQEWAYVLERQGVGADKLADFVKTLSDEQNAVREGSEDMIAAFAKLGISAEEAANSTQEALLKKVITNLQNVEDQTQRVAIAYKIFGEDAAELNNVINLTNQETAQLVENMYLLGGGMSESLIQKSTALSSAVSSLKTAWQGLTYTLGEIFMPIITKVVNWLTKLIAIVNMFLRTVFGFELTPGGSKDAVGSATGSMGNYTESVENATEAVQKLKRVTMGFDELNIVRDPNSASAGAGAGSGGGAGVDSLVGGGISGAIPDVNDLGLGKWKDFFEKYKTLIQDMTTWGLIGVGIGGAVLCALTGNWPGVLACLTLAGIGIGIGSIEGGTFDRLLDNLKKFNLDLIPLAMVAIGAAGAVVAIFLGNIPAAIALAGMAGIGLALGGGFDGLGSILTKYTQDVKGIVTTSMVGIGGVGAVIALLFGNIPVAIGLAAMAGIGLAIGSNGGLGQFIDTYGNEIAKIVNFATTGLAYLGVIMCMLTGNIPGALIFAAIGSIALYGLGTGGSFFTDAITALKNMWQGLADWFNTNIKPVFTVAYWTEKWEFVRQAAATKLEETKKKIQEKWENVRVWFNQTVKPKFTLAYWLSIFEGVRQATATKFEEVKKKIQEKWENIRVWFVQTVKPKFTLAYWQGVFENVRKGIDLKMEEIRTRIAQGWSTISTWFKNTVAPKFTVNYWKTKFSTVKDGMKAAFNGVIEVAEKAVNNIISKLNTLSWKIPSWVPKLGGEKFGFDFKSIKIPRLATGGIATSSTLANVGEAGREAILPLDRNTEWMDALADKIASRNQSPSKIVLKVGEREIGWAAIDGINQITKQTGGLQLQLV